MSAKELFKELGYEYEYKRGTNSEDVIQYHNDNLHIQFNLFSKGVVFQNDSSYVFYGVGCFIVSNSLLNAVITQKNELGWK